MVLNCIVPRINMSTFDGYVKEFPDIRIDHFRTHPDKAPPAACFLSHIHSDHLIGLESLKMPFVYCSATTRRLLLRMEKYPHRINFSKGILESRKQHYRHLKLVLRALPLHTCTELELGPKSKIRVTLIDANHCPGSVMFLIEDDSKAILYTGDVRAEPWWVNSIVQNPFLLPYSCGHRRLDCLYLDTTFSTHDDAYRRFPTKAEGLIELLGQVAKFSDDTVFYFRAWTLGYEHVWMALSNLLRCTIHVDDYQLNLFAGIAENSRDGYSMFEGPALVGFPIGNHMHPGYLAPDSDTRLHSCEPGAACHTELKRKNVVWITPIISRMKDGTELLELGAGGGLGDLYQMPELEVSDAPTLEAFQILCKDVLKDEEDFERVNQSIQAILSSGSSKIPLDGLGLDAEAEISLKEFVQLVSRKENLAKAGGHKKPEPHKAAAVSRSRDRVIHFPYSRHSSYEELRHLVSVFRPKDVCPCTVDLEIWNESITMESLFGDLCSEAIFHHDKETESEAQEIRRLREVNNSLKRKRQDNSQDSQDDHHDSQQDVFTSARASVGSDSAKGKGNAKVSALATSVEDNSLSQRQPLFPSEATPSHTAQRTRTKLDERKDEIRLAFHALNNGSDMITRDQPEPDELPCPTEEAQDSQQTAVSSSVFDSQLLDDDANRLPQVDGMHDETVIAEPQKRDRDKKARHALRHEARDAARTALWRNESGHWNDLNLRSVGRVGHSELEAEL